MTNPQGRQNVQAVQLPHEPLPDYYPPGDLQARESFLRKTFDDTAVDYNKLESILGFGTGASYRGRALKRAGLKPGMTVVDVGMGTGIVSQQILKITGEPGKLIGVDPSPGMMAQAKLPPEVVCKLGRAEEIPVPDASVDFLVMGYALRHISDFSAACTEFRRVLKPGGKLLILEITMPQSRLGTMVLKAYMRGVVPLLARVVSKSATTPMLWRYYWDTIAGCIPPAQVIASLSAAGLHEAGRYVELGIFSEYTARG
ncbi:MAG TPA: class I SAM-dependent methyltransferase [Rhizobacter sp.]